MTHSPTCHGSGGARRFPGPGPSASVTRGRRRFRLHAGCSSQRDAGCAPRHGSRHFPGRLARTDDSGKVGAEIAAHWECRLRSFWVGRLMLRADTTSLTVRGSSTLYGKSKGRAGVDCAHGYQPFLRRPPAWLVHRSKRQRISPSARDFALFGEEERGSRRVDEVGLVV